jgi:hypothetical protein
LVVIKVIRQLTSWSIVLLVKLTARSDTQETPRLLWNQKVHCRVHKSSLPAHFDPEDSDEVLPTSEVLLRWRSAPWDDIIDEPPLTPPSSDTEERDSDGQQEGSEEEPQDFVWVNLLQSTRPAPTFYRSVAVPPIPATSLTEMELPWVHHQLTEGADLPPPFQGPRVFQTTPPSPLMDQVIDDLKNSQIISPGHVAMAFLSVPRF